MTHGQKMPADKNQENSEEKTSLTEEDIGKIVNAAVTSQLKRAIPNAIAESLKTVDWSGTLGTIVDEKLKTFQPPAPEKGQESEGSKADPKIEAQLRAMSEKLEASERRAKEAEDARAQVELQRQRDAGISAFRSKVSEKVRPELLDVFVEHFAGKRLELDEKGNPLFSVKRSPYRGAPEEDVKLSLEEAIPILLTSKEVSPFLPAPGGQQGNGAGKRSATFVPGSSNSSDPAAKTVEDLGRLGIDPSALL